MQLQWVILQKYFLKIMFDFIPILQYTGFYYHILLVVTLYTFLQSRVYFIEQIEATSSIRFIGIFSLAFVIIYMGTRPISWVFGDMLAYAEGFRRIQLMPDAPMKIELFFGYFTKFCTKLMDADTYFLVVDLIYILPYYFLTRKYFSAYWFIPFLMIIGSFSFWSFGTNGIRNGMATSIFILSLLLYQRNKWLMYILMAISYGFHNSLIIPISAFVLSGLYKNPKVYFYIWLAAIPLSLLGENIWTTFFKSLGFEDERVNDYLTQNEEFQKQFSAIGFRWDFVLYSASAVFAGYYYIIKRGFKDQFYTHLWGTYVIANAFWILVIRANFSNRFAYLSWFLMAIIIAYPLFKVKFWDDHYKIVGRIFLAYYLFTYFMFLKS